jgi:phosphatidyl-myo-inositol dimannoside synthase
MTAPARIILVSEVFPPAIGGSGLLLEKVYSGIDDVPVTVLASGDRPAIGQVGRLTVHRVDMSAPDWGVVRPAALRRHLRVAARIRSAAGTTPAVVHCGRGLPEGLSARLASVGRPLSYVCWVHGEELGFASTSRELTRLLRYVYGRAAAVIANSQNSAQLMTRWDVPLDRVTVVHPGVDIERFRPGDSAGLRARLAPEDEIVFLSVGRLQRRKGHDTVIEALAHLPVDLPPVKYVIAGDGPHRAALEDQVRTAGLGDRVMFAGSPADDELPSYYAASDVFVLPNRDDGVDFEGFGIVFLEAAACGLPTIGGRSGGVPEAIAEDRTGLLVDGTDPRQLAAAMERLARSPDLRARLGRAGRTRVCRDFTWTGAANRVRDVHLRLAAAI